MTGKKIIILSILVLGLLVVVRELGIFSDKYSDNYLITQNFHYDIQENNLNLTVSKSGFHTNFGTSDLHQTDIFLKNSGEKSNPAEEYGLELEIKEIKVPLSLIPFYTNTDYEFKAYVDDTIFLVKDDSKNVQLAKKSLKGNFVINGNFKSYELLSNKEIKQRITNESKFYLTQQLRNYLDARE